MKNQVSGVVILVFNVVFSPFKPFRWVQVILFLPWFSKTSPLRSCFLDSRVRMFFFFSKVANIKAKGCIGLFSALLSLLCPSSFFYFVLNLLWAIKLVIRCSFPKSTQVFIGHHFKSSGRFTFRLISLRCGSLVVLIFSNNFLKCVLGNDNTLFHTKFETFCSKTT